MACSDVTLKSDITAETSATSMSDTREDYEHHVADNIPESPVASIDVDASGPLPKPTVDNVCNLSNLFSGELEKRRKQEAKKLMMKSKRRKRSHNTADPKSGGTEDNSGVSHTKKPVLNYFVALQISNTKIKDALKQVQDSIVSQKQQLSGAVTKVSKLHITLMMLSLPTDEDMRKSQVALDNAAQRLLPLHSVSPLILNLSGLGHFGHQVVFAKVKKEDQLESLSNVASVVEESFLDQQIVSPDRRGFKPHATIMKMSQMKGWQKKGLKKIDPDLYTEFVECDFGSDTINTLQLCALGKPKDKHGYYHVEYSTVFGKPLADENLADTSTVDSNNVDTGMETTVDISVETSTDQSVDSGKLGTDINTGKEDTCMDTAVDNSLDRSINTSVDSGALDNIVVTGKVETAIDSTCSGLSCETSEDNEGIDMSCTEVDSESNVMIDKNAETDSVGETLPSQNKPTGTE